MNVFTHMASVQGYGALVSDIYDNATGTHPQAMLNACHLADGTFTQLRLGAIAISSSELMLNTVLGPPVPTDLRAPAPRADRASATSVSG